MLVPEYARKAVGHIVEGADADDCGRTLVLCSSYADVTVLIEHWPDKYRGRLITHGPGVALNVVAEGMPANGFLVTPAGWEGLSPRRGQDSFWSRVVILRNPTPALNPAEQLILVNSLRARGDRKAVAERRANQIGFAQANTQALHKLRQGIGRALRHPDDDVEIVLLDPRFLGAESKARAGAGKGGGLTGAIPPRFWPAFRQALKSERREPSVVL